jgi:hypothetical protein
MNNHSFVRSTAPLVNVETMYGYTQSEWNDLTREKQYFVAKQFRLEHQEQPCCVGIGF